MLLGSIVSSEAAHIFCHYNANLSPLSVDENAEEPPPICKLASFASAISTAVQGRKEINPVYVHLYYIRAGSGDWIEMAIGRLINGPIPIESADVNPSFFCQVAITNASKIPGDWTPDLPTPPCEPPPPVASLSAADERWEDSVPWMEPPNYWVYW